MMHRPIVALTLIAALILAGCQLDTTPEDVAHFSSNRTATKDNAACNATFVLYHDDVDNVATEPLATVHLKKDEVFGFEFDEHQTPLAIAGTQHVQLTAGRYRWEMRPDRGQVDWDKTGIVVLEVAVITALVVGTVVISIVIAKHS